MKRIMDTKPRKLYHGSQYKITEGVIRVKPAYCNHMTTKVTAVFATPDVVHAGLYAIMRLVALGIAMPRTRDTLYIQKLNPNIPEKAYVYELDSVGFERDADGNYFSLTDKPIKDVIEIDIMQEIRKNNLKVYILKNKIDFLNMSKDEFKRLVEQQIVGDKDNFVLYNPDAKNLDMMIVTNAMQSEK